MLRVACCLTLCAAEAMAKRCAPSLLCKTNTRNTRTRTQTHARPGVAKGGMKAGDAAYTVDLPQTGGPFFLGVARKAAGGGGGGGAAQRAVFNVSGCVRRLAADRWLVFLPCIADVTEQLARDILS
jgi:hypothetical protein